jgi:hypothetical protein
LRRFGVSGALGSAELLSGGGIACLPTQLGKGAIQGVEQLNGSVFLGKLKLDLEAKLAEECKT